jgi:hypothetical protein
MLHDQGNEFKKLLPWLSTFLRLLILRQIAEQAMCGAITICKMHFPGEGIKRKN